MKNNKGISLIALIVMIIVMIILAAIAMNATTESYDKSLETKANEERAQVQYAVSTRFGENQRNSTSNPIIGIMVPEENRSTIDLSVTYIITKLKSDYGKFVTEDNAKQEADIKKFVTDNFEDMEYTRILTATDLIELDIENTNINAVYVVNYYSADVVGPIN